MKITDNGEVKKNILFRNNNTIMENNYFNLEAKGCTKELPWFSFYDCLYCTLTEIQITTHFYQIIAAEFTE